MWFLVESRFDGEERCDRAPRPESLPRGCLEWLEGWMPFWAAAIEDLRKMCVGLNAFDGEPKVYRTASLGMSDSTKTKKLSSFSGGGAAAVRSGFVDGSFDHVQPWALVYPERESFREMTYSTGLSGFFVASTTAGFGRGWRVEFADDFIHGDSGVVTIEGVPAAGRRPADRHTDPQSLMVDEIPQDWVESCWAEFVRTVRGLAPLQGGYCDLSKWRLDETYGWLEWPEVLPSQVLGYQWGIALTDAQVERLGGVDAVLADAPVWSAEAVETPAGPVVVCRLTENPCRVDVSERLAWRNYLQPVLPERYPIADLAGRQREYLDLPKQLCVEDWDWPGRDRELFVLPSDPGWMHPVEYWRRVEDDSE